MGAVENILNFITDRTRRLSSRATIVVLVVAAVLLIDNILGFSEYYNKRRQLDQLQSISVLLKDTTLSPEIKSKLIELQNRTLDRKSIIDKTISFFKNITTTGSTVTGPDTKIGRSNFWFLISSSGLYLLVIIFVVPVLLFTDKQTPLLKLVAILLMFIIAIGTVSLFNYWLFDKILPDRLWGSWVWNYVVNFILQIGFGLGFSWVTNWSNKKTKLKSASR